MEDIKFPTLQEAKLRNQTHTTFTTKCGIMFNITNATINATSIMEDFNGYAPILASFKHEKLNITNIRDFDGKVTFSQLKSDIVFDISTRTFELVHRKIDISRNDAREHIVFGNNIYYLVTEGKETYMTMHASDTSAVKAKSAGIERIPFMGKVSLTINEDQTMIMVHACGRLTALDMTTLETIFEFDDIECFNDDYLVQAVNGDSGFKYDILDAHTLNVLCSHWFRYRPCETKLYGKWILVQEWTDSTDINLFNIKLRISKDYSAERKKDIHSFAVANSKLMLFR